MVRDRWQGAVPKRLHDLHQAGRARGGVEVTDVRLGRTEPTEPHSVGVGAERLGEGRHLDRVTDRGAGAVRFEQADRARVDPGHGERLFDDVGVPVHARREEPDLAVAIVVDGGPFDHREDRVAVAVRIGEPTERNDGRPAGQHGSVGVRVEGSAATGRRQDLTLSMLVTAAVRELDRNAAGERQVALEGEQALDGEMHRDE